MNKKLYFVVSLMVLMLMFTLVSCSTTRAFKKGFEKGLKGEAEKVEEVEEGVVEETIEEPIVEEKSTKEIEKENINKFFEQIREYGILVRNLDYCTMDYEAISDWASGEISKRDVGSKYMEIAGKVSDDYFLFDMLFTIGESSLEKEGIIITDDMKRVIELISNWSNKKARYYEYMANYYHGDGSEYEIEANKIADELDEITDEYIELTNEMTEKVKTE